MDQGPGIPKVRNQLGNHACETTSVKEPKPKEEGTQARIMD